ncbi:MAG: MraY family glycosyltransferase [Patescibacteria group bacterium]
MYILAFTLAFILTFLFTYLVRKLALRYQIVDRPFLTRKIHKRTIPLLGGMSIFIGILLTLGYFSLFTDKMFGGYMLPKHIIGLLLGGTILVIGGILDDKYNLKPRQQFIWPLAAAVIVISSGIGINYITNPLGEAIQLDQIKIKIFEWGGLPYNFILFADLFTLVWLLGMIYTTKFLDGLDGLVSGISVVTAFVLFFLSISPKVIQPETAMVAIIVAGAAAAFLCWNFHPAKIFLGEGGSTLLGFLLGVLAIISGGKIATALLCMGVPILDALWVILRRLFSRTSPFFGDKKHLHFRLLDIGFSHRFAVIFLWLLSAGFGITALFLQGKEKVYSLVVLGGIMILLGIAVVYVYKFRQKA